MYQYFIKTQFLGFRYSGWQIQPGQKTVEGMLLKTLSFILPNTKVKILGTGRTDSKVSALAYYFELRIDENEIYDLDAFKALFNSNLPPDIRILSIALGDKEMNIIKNSKVKEYVYLFSFGEKNHPFCAPFMANVLDDLDFPLMQEGASLFEGTHDFSNYTAQLRDGAKTMRTVDSCILKENTILSANFFPGNSYALHIKGAGFIRYQVRMIMGALIQLGLNKLSLDDISLSLRPNQAFQLSYIAPGSGLLLNAVEFSSSKSCD